MANLVINNKNYTKTGNIKVNVSTGGLKTYNLNIIKSECTITAP